MDSTCKRSSGSFSFEANRPRFFKIIIQDTILNGTLGIPNKFVREFGKYLSNNKAILKVPTGAVWEVELFKSDGKIWLKNGWRKFMECYSLVPGSLLVFECESCGCFNVLIFDKSALEIDYPSSTSNVAVELDLEEQLEEPAAEGTKDDVSIEIIDDFPPRSETKEKVSVVPCPQPQERMRVNLPSKFERAAELETDTVSATLKQDKSMRESNAHHPVPQSEGGSRGTSSQKEMPSVINWTKELVTDDEKANALRRASASFKSTNPFFMVVMQPSYVIGHRLAIPASFVWQYVKNEHGDAILCALGRTWSVKYWNKSGNGRAQITGGWHKFSRDNYLEVGDVCVFELTNSTEVLFEVFISRAVKNYCISVGDERAENQVQSKLIDVDPEFQGDDEDGTPSSCYQYSTNEQGGSSV